MLQDAGATWLLAWVEPEIRTSPSACAISAWAARARLGAIVEIGAVRGALGLPVERDLFFEAATPLSRYAADALKLGMISA